MSCFPRKNSRIVTMKRQRVQVLPQNHPKRQSNTLFKSLVCTVAVRSMHPRLVRLQGHVSFGYSMSKKLKIDCRERADGQQTGVHPEQVLWHDRLHLSGSKSKFIVLIGLYPGWHKDCDCEKISLNQFASSLE